MRCDEIREKLVELLYGDERAAGADRQVQEHVRDCPVCRRELEELKGVQGLLRMWEDEPPLRPVSMPEDRMFRQQVSSFWRFARYAAAAAVLILAFLALSNAEMTWNSDGFSFRTRLLTPGTADSYTRAETINLLKNALDDSESRMNEANFLMMQRMMDTIEEDRWMELRQISQQWQQSRGKN